MRRSGLILVFCLLATTAWAGDAAERQLGFCWEELQAGKYERAATSATSAFRLDANLHDALVCKAEAQAAAGQDDLARGTMAAYVQLRLGLKSSERASALMEDLGVNDDGSVTGGKAKAAPQAGGAATAGPGPVPGIILAAAGGALGGVGAGLHGAAWNDAQAGAPGL